MRGSGKAVFLRLDQFRLRKLQSALAAVMGLNACLACAAVQNPPQQTPSPAQTQTAIPPQQPSPAIQSPTPSTATPQTLPNPAPGASAPGSGAQVRTGSTIGGSQTQAARVLTLLADHQFPQIQRLLDNAPSDDNSAALTPEQKTLFRGVLANRENKPQQSIDLLAPLVDSVTAGSDRQAEKLVRQTLAEDYLRAGQWARANHAYAALNQRLGASLTADEKEALELPIKLLPLVASNPPMTVQPGETFTLPYDRDPLGLTDIPVFVDAQPHDWMLDPTLPFNLISRSTAHDIGLKLSDDSATVHGITGRTMQVHATIIPRFTLGTVTFRNMTAFVFEDADYAFPRSKYQVQGVLGYPAVSALGSLTVTQNATIVVQPGDKGDRVTGGVPFYLDGDQIVLALGKKGDERMYVVDAAGQQTYLTSRYLSEHASDFANLKMQLLALPGASAKPPAPAYVAESVGLTVGDEKIDLHYVQVLTQPLGSAAVDDIYGLLGMDALDELSSYTFDYRTMRFAIKAQ